MTVHTDRSRRDRRKRRIFDRRMAVTAVDAQIARVQGVAVWNGLHGRIANVGSLRRPGIIDNADNVDGYDNQRNSGQWPCPVDPWWKA